MLTNRCALIGRTTRLVFIAAFSLAGLATAQAQVTAEQRAACTPDAMRLCSSENSGYRPRHGLHES